MDRNQLDYFACTILKFSINKIMYQSIYPQRTNINHFDRQHKSTYNKHQEEIVHQNYVDTIYNHVNCNLLLNNVGKTSSGKYHRDN